MHLRQLTIPLLTLLPLLAAAGGKQTPERHAAATAAVAGTAGEEPAAADTVIVVDKVQVTAIKQGMVLRSQPVAATIVGSRAIERERIGALKHLSQQVPNFFAPDYGSRMTSSIYVRGLGARIDQPVIGLNIDNVPVLNKDNFDTELADAERIEVLRGPQSTLYGRNTMGGVVNVYTLSPLSYEGVRLSAEYGSGDSYKFRASSYYKLTPDLGMAVTGYYTHTGGFFENLATGDKCDWERLGGGRWKTQWRSRTGLRIDNTLSFSVLEQGGYPYAYAGDDIIGDDGRPVVRRGEIRYNDPCSYRRTALSDGLTIRYDAGNFTVASITCYQYSDDEMILDQDFLPLSYFTLRQARTEHSVTEDLVFRSRGDKAYRWLLGAFGFYRHGTMNAPVHFKQTGIEELILKYANENDQSYRYSWGLKDGTGGDELFLGSDFRMPSAGGALYHESNYTLGRWRFTAGLRFDFEHARLRYRNYTDTWYTKTHIKNETAYERPIDIDDRSTLKQTFTELLPKFSVMYSFDETRNLYLTIAKGYKSGGFNTQIFSDVLQQKMMNRMGIGEVYDVQRGVAYKPEYSWNYEIGGPAAHRLSAGTDHRPHDDQRRAHAQSRSRSGRSDFAVAHLRHQPRVRLHRRPVCPVRNDRKERRRRSRAHQLQGQPHPLRPATHPFGRSRMDRPDRREMARRSGVSGRRPLRGPHLVERRKYAFTTFLRAYGRFGTLRTRPLLAQRLGPQPHRRRLRRILFQIDRQRVRPARTPPHIRHHTEH